MEEQQRERKCVFVSMFVETKPAIHNLSILWCFYFFFRVSVGKFNSFFNATTGTGIRM